MASADTMLAVQVADCALTSLRLQESGALAAVGSADGATTLLRLCDGLVDMQPAEKQSLAAVCGSPNPAFYWVSAAARYQSSLFLSGCLQAGAAAIHVPASRAADLSSHLSWRCAPWAQGCLLLLY